MFPTGAAGTLARPSSLSQAKVKMAARSYSPGELLRMREAPLTGWLSHHLRQLLRENTDLSES